MEEEEEVVVAGLLLLLLLPVLLDRGMGTMAIRLVGGAERLVDLVCISVVVWVMMAVLLLLLMVALLLQQVGYWGRVSVE